MMAGTLVCYGDSNTYGYDPRRFPEDRYPEAIRWTARLEEMTGVRVLNYGLNGRCIPWQESQILFLAAQMESWAKEDEPVRLWIMLGTNDLLQMKEPDAEIAASRMESLLNVLKGTEAFRKGRINIRILAPPLLKRGAWVESDALCRESARLGKLYENLCAKAGVDFSDTGRWDIPLIFDGVHFSEAGHTKFADKAAEIHFQRDENGRNEQ